MGAVLLTNVNGAPGLDLSLGQTALGAGILMGGVGILNWLIEKVFRVPKYQLDSTKELGRLLKQDAKKLGKSAQGHVRYQLQTGHQLPGQILLPRRAILQFNADKDEISWKLPTDYELVGRVGKHPRGTILTFDQDGKLIRVSSPSNAAKILGVGAFLAASLTPSLAEAAQAGVSNLSSHPWLWGLAAATAGALGVIGTLGSQTDVTSVLDLSLAEVEGLIAEQPAKLTQAHVDWLGKKLLRAEDAQAFVRIFRLFCEAAQLSPEIENESIADLEKALVAKVAERFDRAFMDEVLGLPLGMNSERLKSFVNQVSFAIEVSALAVFVPRARALDSEGSEIAFPEDPHSELRERLGSLSMQFRQGLNPVLVSMGDRLESALEELNQLRRTEDAEQVQRVSQHIRELEQEFLNKRLVMVEDALGALSPDGFSELRHSFEQACANKEDFNFAVWENEIRHEVSEVLAAQALVVLNQDSDKFVSELPQSLRSSIEGVVDYLIKLHLLDQETSIQTIEEFVKEVVGFYQKFPNENFKIQLSSANAHHLLGTHLNANQYLQTIIHNLRGYCRLFKEHAGGIFNRQEALVAPITSRDGEATNFRLVMARGHQDVETGVHLLVYEEGLNDQSLEACTAKIGLHFGENNTLQIVNLQGSSKFYPELEGSLKRFQTAWGNSRTERKGHVFDMLVASVVRYAKAQGFSKVELIQGAAQTSYFDKKQWAQVEEGTRDIYNSTAARFGFTPPKPDSDFWTLDLDSLDIDREGQEPIGPNTLEDYLAHVLVRSNANNEVRRDLWDNKAANPQAPQVYNFWNIFAKAMDGLRYQGVEEQVEEHPTKKEGGIAARAGLLAIGTGLITFLVPSLAEAAQAGVAHLSSHPWLWGLAAATVGVSVPVLALNGHDLEVLRAKPRDEDVADPEILVQEIEAMSFEKREELAAELKEVFADQDIEVSERVTALSYYKLLLAYLEGDAFEEDDSHQLRMAPTYLTQVLEDPNLQVRRAALTAYAQLLNLKSGDVLLMIAAEKICRKLLWDSDPEIRDLALAGYRVVATNSGRITPLITSMAAILKDEGEVPSHLSPNRALEQLMYAFLQLDSANVLRVWGHVRTEFREEALEEFFHQLLGALQAEEAVVRINAAKYILKLLEAGIDSKDGLDTALKLVQRLGADVDLETKRNIIEFLVKNFPIFEELGLWEKVATAEVLQSLGLSQEEAQLLLDELLRRHNKRLVSHKGWKYLLNYLVDLNEDRRVILHALLESRARVLTITSALGRINHIPRVWKDEVSQEIAQQIEGWEKKASTETPSRATRVKKYVEAAKKRRLAPFSNNKIVQLILECADSMNEAGKRVLNKLYENLLGATVIGKKIFFPQRYEELTAKGFHQEFVKWWGKEFLKPLNDSTAIEVSGRPDVMALLGELPFRTCLCLSVREVKPGNKSGQPLALMLHGQFKVANYLQDGKVLARRLIEVTRDPSGRPVLLAYFLHYPRSEFDQGQQIQFKKEIREYAKSLGIIEDNIYFAEDGPIDNLEREAAIKTMGLAQAEVPNESRQRVPVPLSVEHRVDRDAWNKSMPASARHEQESYTPPQETPEGFWEIPKVSEETAPLSSFPPGIGEVGLVEYLAGESSPPSSNPDSNTELQAPFLALAAASSMINPDSWPAALVVLVLGVIQLVRQRLGKPDQPKPDAAGLREQAAKLREALQNPDPAVRQQAAQTYHQVVESMEPSERDAEVCRLHALFKDPDPEIRLLVASVYVSFFAEDRPYHLLGGNRLGMMLLDLFLSTEADVRTRALPVYQKLINVKPGCLLPLVTKIAQGITTSSETDDVRLLLQSFLQVEATESLQQRCMNSFLVHLKDNKEHLHAFVALVGQFIRDPNPVVRSNALFYLNAFLQAHYYRVFEAQAVLEAAREGLLDQEASLVERGLALQIYEHLSLDFDPELYQGFKTAREQWDHSTESERQAAFEVYRRASAYFVGGDPEIRPGARAVQKYFDDPDLSVRQAAFQIYQNLSERFQREDINVEQELNRLRSYLNDADSVIREAAFKSYANLFAFLQASEEQVLSTEFFGLLGYLGTKNPLDLQHRIARLLCDKANFKKLTELGLWKKVFQGKGGKLWELAAEDRAKLQQLMDARIQARQGWEALLKFLADVNSDKLKILRGLLAPEAAFSNGKTRNILSAIAAFDKLSGSLAAELIPALAAKINTWPTESDSGVDNASRATRLKNEVTKAIQQSEAQRTARNRGDTIQLLRGSYRFMDEGGRALLKRLLAQIEMFGQVSGEKIFLPNRYHELEDMGFALSFIKRWAEEYEAPVRQDPYGAAVRKAEENDFSPLKTQIESRLPEELKDLRNRLSAERSNYRKNEEDSIEISGRVDVMAWIGEVPEVTCQRLSGPHEDQVNGDGSPLSRILHGQFKAANYLVDGEVQGRRLLEITRNELGEPLLLVHKLYYGKKLDVERKVQFKEEMMAYAASIGIDKSHVYFSEDKQDGQDIPRPLELANPVIRDDWKETVAPQDLRPQPEPKDGLATHQERWQQDAAKLYPQVQTLLAWVKGSDTNAKVTSLVKPLLKGDASKLRQAERMLRPLLVADEASHRTRALAAYQALVKQQPGRANSLTTDIANALKAPQEDCAYNSGSNRQAAELWLDVLLQLQNLPPAVIEDYIDSISKALQTHSQAQKTFIEMLTARLTNADSAVQKNALICLAGFLRSYSGEIPQADTIQSAIRSILFNEATPIGEQDWALEVYEKVAQGLSEEIVERFKAVRNYFADPDESVQQVAWNVYQRIVPYLKTGDPEVEIGLGFAERSLIHPNQSVCESAFQVFVTLYNLHSPEEVVAAAPQDLTQEQAQLQSYHDQWIAELQGLGGKLGSYSFDKEIDQTPGGRQALPQNLQDWIQNQSSENLQFQQVVFRPDDHDAFDQDIHSNLKFYETLMMLTAGHLRLPSKFFYYRDEDGNYVIRFLSTELFLNLAPIVYGSQAMGYERTSNLSCYAEIREMFRRHRWPLLISDQYYDIEEHGVTKLRSAMAIYHDLFHTLRLSRIPPQIRRAMTAIFDSWERQGHYNESEIATIIDSLADGDHQEFKGTIMTFAGTIAIKARARQWVKDTGGKFLEGALNLVPHAGAREVARQAVSAVASGIRQLFHRLKKVSETRNAPILPLAGASLLGAQSLDAGLQTFYNPEMTPSLSLVSVENFLIAALAAALTGFLSYWGARLWSQRRHNASQTDSNPQAKEPGSVPPSLLDLSRRTSPDITFNDEISDRVEMLKILIETLSSSDQVAPSKKEEWAGRINDLWIFAKMPLANPEEVLQTVVALESELQRCLTSLDTPSSPINQPTIQAIQARVRDKLNVQSGQLLPQAVDAVECAILDTYQVIKQLDLLRAGFSLKTFWDFIDETVAFYQKFPHHTLNFQGDSGHHFTRHSLLGSNPTADTYLKMIINNLRGYQRVFGDKAGPLFHHQARWVSPIRDADWQKTGLYLIMERGNNAVGTGLRFAIVAGDYHGRRLDFLAQVGLHFGEEGTIQIVNIQGPYKKASAQFFVSEESQAQLQDLLGGKNIFEVLIKGVVQWASTRGFSEIQGVKGAANISYQDAKAKRARAGKKDSTDFYDRTFQKLGFNPPAEGSDYWSQDFQNIKLAPPKILDRAFQELKPQSQYRDARSMYLGSGVFQAPFLGLAAAVGVTNPDLGVSGILLSLAALTVGAVVHHLSQEKQPDPALQAKRDRYEAFANEQGIPLDAWLGAIYTGKANGKVTQVSEALEILFGELEGDEQALQEIAWIEGNEVGAGYQRLKHHAIQSPSCQVRIRALQALLKLHALGLVKLTFSSADLKKLVQQHGRENPSDLDESQTEELKHLLQAWMAYQSGERAFDPNKKLSDFLESLQASHDEEVQVLARTVALQMRISTRFDQHRDEIAELLHSPNVLDRRVALNFIKASGVWAQDRNLLNVADLLVRTTPDEDVVVRALALELLANRISAGELLGVLLKDPSSEVKTAVVKALKKQELIRWLTQDLSFSLTQDFSPEVLGELLDTPIIWNDCYKSDFLSLLKHSDLRIRLGAAQVLTGWGEPEAASEVYQECLRHQDSNIRYQALISLLKLSAENSKQLIIQSSVKQLLQDEDPQVCWAAARVVRHLKLKVYEDSKAAWKDLQTELSQKPDPPPPDSDSRSSFMMAGLGAAGMSQGLSTLLMDGAVSSGSWSTFGLVSGVALGVLFLVRGLTWLLGNRFAAPFQETDSQDSLESQFAQAKQAFKAGEISPKEYRDRLATLLETMQKSNRPAYQAVQGFLHNLAEDADLSIKVIESREKKIQAALEKIRKTQTTHPMALYDLMSCRVVVPDNYAVDRVIEAIQEEYPEISESEMYRQGKIGRTREAYHPDGSIKLDVVGTETLVTNKDGQKSIEEALLLDAEPAKNGDKRLWIGSKSGRRAKHIIVEVHGHPVEIQVINEAMYEWAKLEERMVYHNPIAIESTLLDKIRNFCRQAAEYLHHATHPDLGEPVGEIPEAPEIFDDTVINSDLSTEDEVNERGVLREHLQKMVALMEDYQEEPPTVSAKRLIRNHRVEDTEDVAADGTYGHNALMITFGSAAMGTGLGTAVAPATSLTEQLLRALPMVLAGGMAVWGFFPKLGEQLRGIVQQARGLVKGLRGEHNFSFSFDFQRSIFSPPPSVTPAISAKAGIHPATNSDSTTKSDSPTMISDADYRAFIQDSHQDIASEQDAHLNISPTHQQHFQAVFAKYERGELTADQAIVQQLDILQDDLIESLAPYQPVVKTYSFKRIIETVLKAGVKIPEGLKAWVEAHSEEDLQFPEIILSVEALSRMREDDPDLYNSLVYHKELLVLFASDFKLSSGAFYSRLEEGGRIRFLSGSLALQLASLYSGSKACGLAPKPRTSPNLEIIQLAEEDKRPLLLATKYQRNIHEIRAVHPFVAAEHDFVHHLKYSQVEPSVRRALSSILGLVQNNLPSSSATHYILADGLDAVASSEDPTEVAEDLLSRTISGLGSDQMVAVIQGRDLASRQSPLLPMAIGVPFAQVAAEPALGGDMGLWVGVGLAAVATVGAAALLWKRFRPLKEKAQREKILAKPAYDLSEEQRQVLKPIFQKLYQTDQVPPRLTGQQYLEIKSTLRDSVTIEPMSNSIGRKNSPDFMVYLDLSMHFYNGSGPVSNDASEDHDGEFDGWELSETP